MDSITGVRRLILRLREHELTVSQVMTYSISYDQSWHTLWVQLLPYEFQNLGWNDPLRFHLGAMLFTWSDSFLFFHSFVSNLQKDFFLHDCYDVDASEFNR